MVYQILYKRYGVSNVCVSKRNCMSHIILKFGPIAIHGHFAIFLHRVFVGLVSFVRCGTRTTFSTAQVVIRVAGRGAPTPVGLTECMQHTNHIMLCPYMLELEFWTLGFSFASIYCLHRTRNKNLSERLSPVLVMSFLLLNCSFIVKTCVARESKHVGIL